MTEPSANDSVYSALSDLGPDGARAAEWFAAGFQEVQTEKPRAGNFIAYCGREALGAVLDLGGPRPPGARTAAIEHVLDMAEAVQRDGADQSVLLTSIDALRQAHRARAPSPHAPRLEALMLQITHRAPVRTQADLLDQFLSCLDALNVLTHSASPADRDEASRQLNTAFKITGRLLGPLPPHLDDIDALIAIAAPSYDDVDALLNWHGDARILGYFFSRLNGLGWFQALVEHDILAPQDIGWWPALDYLLGLGQTHPTEIADWLSRQPGGSALTTQQAFHYFRLAAAVAAPMDAAMFAIVAGHLGNPNLLAGVARYLRSRPAEGQDSRGTFALAKQGLQELIDSDRTAGRAHLIESMLHATVELSRQGDAQRWLGVVRAKVGELVRDDELGYWAIRRIPNLITARLEAMESPLDQFVIACRDVARVAHTVGVSQSQRADQFGRLPPLLAARLTAADLLAEPDSDQGAAIELLRQQLAGADPMPETLELLRHVGEHGSVDLSNVWREALGTPPTKEQVATFSPELPIPESWGRAFGWSVALATVAVEGWEAAIAVCRSRWGQPLPEGLVIGPPVAYFEPRHSPFTAEDFRDKTPVEVAQDIAGWRPDPSDLSAGNRHDLSLVLGELVERDPAAWMGTDAPQIVRILGARDYLVAYFQSIRKAADGPALRDDPLPASVLDAVEALADIEHRERSADPAGGNGPPWGNIWSMALPLLPRLRLDGPQAQQRAWAVIGARLDPGESVAQYGPTRYASAIAAAVGIADQTMQSDQLPAPLADMLDRALTLGRPLAHPVRTAIGANLSWLYARAPAWTEQHFDALVGDTAAHGLGPFTFGAYLERGRVSESLLLRFRDQIWASLATHPAGAERHILHGLIWGVAGYDAPTVVARLAASGQPAAVSSAAQRLWRAASTTATLSRDPLVTFWEAALVADLPPEQYEGFGYLVEVEGIDDGRWLTFTLQTAERCSSGLALVDRIAARAARHPDDVRALALVTALLRSEVDLWDVYEVGQAGLAILRATQATDHGAVAALREALLEREFFEAREL